MYCMLMWVNVVILLKEKKSKNKNKTYCVATGIADFGYELTSKKCSHDQYPKAIDDNSIHFINLFIPHLES